MVLCVQVKSFLHDAGVKCLTWPGNSPDLNPIENCWHMMSRKVAEHKPRSVLELQTTLIRVWFHEISPEYLVKLISSMPSRIEAVIKAKGGATKY